MRNIESKKLYPFLYNCVATRHVITKAENVTCPPPNIILLLIILYNNRTLPLLTLQVILCHIKQSDQSTFF
jgi:hypothetical protein